MNPQYVQTRVFRSPYWMVGWVVTAIAVVGTVAFFVGGTSTSPGPAVGGDRLLCGSVGRTLPSRLH
jgi:hypothetical protein